MLMGAAVDGDAEASSFLKVRATAASYFNI